MSLADVKLHLVDSMDDVAAFKQWLGHRRPILAVDTETEGLEWWHQKVRLVQIGDVNDGWAFPWQLWGGPACEALRAYDGPIAMHNAKFDVHMLEHWSKELHLPLQLNRHQVHDSRVMSHILDPQRATGLKFLCSLFVDAKSAQASIVLDETMAANKWTWATVPVACEAYWAYGALDTVLTARLHEYLHPQVMAEAPKAYDLEMASNWVCERMERNGCHVDVKWTTEKHAAFMEYVEQASAWTLENYGVKAGSDVDIIKRLQADGIQFTKMTNSGARHSLDKEVLESIIEATHHPLAEIVLQRRRLLKLASTYFDNFLRLQVDGLLHPTFNTLKNEDSGYGARTGRQTVTEPPLQTLPRKNNSSPQALTVRNCITASEKHTLVMCDFDQIEMRMMAHFANDPALMAAFGEGDFFSNIARELYQDPELVKSDPRRQFTKNGMYALGYGAGPEKIALTTKHPVEQVREFLDLLAIRFPGIKQLQRDVELAARARLEAEGAAYVRSPLTNRRHTADAGKAYTLVNYLIQGTAAEVLKYKNVELANIGLEEFMILNVHDEVILDVPDDQLDEVSRLVNDVMNDSNFFRVPLTATVDKAFRWGEKGS